MNQPFPPQDNEDEVSQFLSVFHRQREVYGIVFYHPDQNFQALLDMEVSPKDRERLIDKVERDDFYDKKNDCHHTCITCWRFRTKLKAKEIHIIISLGLPEEPVRCYGFYRV